MIDVFQIIQDFNSAIADLLYSSLSVILLVSASLIALSYLWSFLVYCIRVGAFGSTVDHWVKPAYRGQTFFDKFRSRKYNFEKADRMDLMPH